MSKKYVSVLKDSSATPGYRIIAPEDYVYTENGTKKVKKIDSKADKKVPASAGNLAALDSTGNLADSGKKTSDFMAALPTAYSSSGSATKTVTKVEQATTGEVSVTYSDIQTASTSQKGLVQLEDSTSSTSTSKAATPNAVKAAYDLANGKYSRPSGGIPSSDLDSSVQASLGKADSAIQGVKLNGTTLTPSSAKVVDLGNLKTTQAAVTDPTASGTTITAIATISQDTNGVITATKKTIRSASSEQSGVMSAADYTKLAGIATGAEVNQNAFSNVKVGDVTVAADSKTDTLTVVAGSNVTITPDATNDKITIAATDTTYTADDGIKLDGTVFKHTNSVSGGTVGPTTDTAGASFSIPYVTYDSQGHVTASGTRTHDVGTASTSGAGIVQLQDTIDSTATKAATPNAVKKAIESLDVGSVGGAGKYISAISESDGKISATATTMDSTPTASSTNAVTSGGVKTELDKKADADSVIAIADATVTKSSSSEWFKVAEYTYSNTSGFVWNGTWMCTLNGTNSARTPFSGLTFFIRFGARFVNSSSAPTDMSFTSSVVDESLKTYINNVKFKLVFDVSGSSTVARLYYSPRMTYCMLALREVMGAIGNTASRKSRWTYTSYSSSSAADSTEPVGNSANLTMSWVYSASPDSVDLKADKVTGATSGHLASLDATGNLLDSGKSVSDLANVQADWDATSGDAFIKNKPFHEKYIGSAVKFKVCTVAEVTAGGTNANGIEVFYRRGNGGVHGNLLNKAGWELYLERIGDVSANSNTIRLYYVTNPTSANRRDIYADSGSYCRLRVAPLANLPKSEVDFSDFGTEVSSLPEGATEITPVWVASTAASSGTAPVKVDAYGTLTAVPMDSTPTASSTNLMTSGAIKTALDGISADVYSWYRTGNGNGSATTYKVCSISNFGTNNWTGFRFVFDYIMEYNSAYAESTGCVEIKVRTVGTSEPDYYIAVRPDGGKKSTSLMPTFRLYKKWADNKLSMILCVTVGGSMYNGISMRIHGCMNQSGYDYAGLVSMATNTVYADETGYTEATLSGYLTYKTVYTNDSAVGSTSVPVYVNGEGAVTACTDDFVHDGDVTSTYSSTGTAPVNGTAVAEAIASTDFSHISQNKLWHSLTVANTGSSQGWFKFATINKKSISYESYRIVGYLYYDEAGNFNSGALKRIPFQAIVNYTSDVYRLLIGKSTTGTRLRLAKISDTKYELQFYAYTNKSIGIHATHDKTNSATNDVVFETTLVAGSEAASVVTVEEDLELGSFAYRSVGDKDGNDITTTYAKSADIPLATTTTPKMDGTAAVGSEAKWAKGDHVHPTDTSRAPTSHASSATTYGVGTSANYGHVKLDNTTPLTVGTTSTDGVATGKAHMHNAIESVARASVTTADLAHINTNTRAHMIFSQISAETSTTHDPGDGYMLSFMWDNTGKHDAQLFIPDSGIAAAGDFGRLKIRYCNNNAWGDWGYLPAASQATTLTSSDNLNSFKGTVLGSSVSYCWTSGNPPTGAAEITGEGTAPTAVMQVIRTHSNYCIQVAYTASKGMFWRWASGDTWSSWTKILTGADIPGTITKSDIDDIWASV